MHLFMLSDLQAGLPGMLDQHGTTILRARLSKSHDPVLARKLRAGRAYEADMVIKRRKTPEEIERGLEDKTKDHFHA